MQHTCRTARPTTTGLVILSLALFTILTAFTTSCVTGPSKERVACINQCTTDKDACLLEAGDSPAIQRCDRLASECVSQCPEY